MFSARPTEHHKRKGGSSGAQLRTSATGSDRSATDMERTCLGPKDRATLIDFLSRLELRLVIVVVVVVVSQAFRQIRCCLKNRATRKVVYKTRYTGRRTVYVCGARFFPFGKPNAHVAVARSESSTRSIYGIGQTSCTRSVRAKAGSSVPHSVSPPSTQLRGCTVPHWWQGAWPIDREDQRSIDRFVRWERRPPSSRPETNANTRRTRRGHTNEWCNYFTPPPRCRWNSVCISISEHSLASNCPGKQREPGCSAPAPAGVPIRASLVARCLTLSNSVTVHRVPHVINS